MERAGDCNGDFGVPAADAETDLGDSGDAGLLKEEEDDFVRTGILSLEWKRTSEPENRPTTPSQ